MQSRKLASGATLAVAFALAGCSGSLLESKKIDYKSAAATATRPTLEVPPDLTAPTADDRYAVPDVSPKGTATYSAYSAERAGQTAAPLATLQVRVVQLRPVVAGSVTTVLVALPGPLLITVMV